jgi:hypothetical protein
MAARARIIIIIMLASSSCLVLGRYGPYRFSDCSTVPGIAASTIDYYHYHCYGGCETNNHCFHA